MPVKNEEYIGQTATLATKENPFYMEIRIVDVRVTFGREEALVTPVNGKGQKWVLFNRLAMERKQ